ncbi:cytochrome c maturation protein CcmE domain-containing protein [Larkinella arboricola]|uniref:Cytochrome c-type biogenesis protein CcmE n=1 Tax=Larkinella arboricola TaxID=643671 RepID=A0A327X292_LARAB|nr:cytochrome c maturation protein CcmE [Larkinella arboricola]RAJ99788.1 cytochrome c-type biogenesis protein CcmE [Larkinella arboricola]
MKKTHIFGIIIIALAIGIIISTAGDASSYVSFTQAAEMAQSGEKDGVHVVGKLTKDAQGQITNMVYQPQIDPNHFEFTLVDNENRTQKVVYNAPKPQDFDRSEQVVVIGTMNGDHFQADKILLKCPSKYQENKLETKEYEAKKATI